MTKRKEILAKLEKKGQKKIFNVQLTMNLFYDIHLIPEFNKDVDNIDAEGNWISDFAPTDSKKKVKKPTPVATETQVSFEFLFFTFEYKVLERL